MTKQLTIGPETGHLLAALRCIEDAKNNYYEAVLAAIGEEETERIMQIYAPKFDAVRELIEQDIATNLRDWANSTSRPTIV